MNKDQIRDIYKWYYKPGEVLRGIGFFMNPYKQWKFAKFRHIFAFDSIGNLYVGQYSVYKEHMNKIFGLEDKREYGMLYMKNSSVAPKYSKNEAEEFGLNVENTLITEFAPVVEFEFLEHKNINYLNLRLKKMAQRFYDYGMPEETVFLSKQIDLWYPTIRSILKGKMLERPSLEWFRNYAII